MNEAHIHLMINHLPIVGLLFSTGLLLLAHWRGGPELLKIALGMTAVASLLAIPAYFSGEGAEEVVEHLPGISETLIENHEELAELGLILTQLTGLMALVAFFLQRWEHQWWKWGARLTLIASMVTLGILGAVANSGGQINHPELRGDTPNMSSLQQHHGKEARDDDDD